MPTPKPTPKPTPRPRSGGGGGGGAAPVYSGGAVGLARRRRRQLHQPVLPLRPLRRRHRRDYGSSIVSPLAGTVVFAGWKSNGGGYQVWIIARQRASTALTPHVRRRRSRPASPSAQGPARRPRRHRAAGRPARTTTSRSGSARPGRAAPTASTRSATTEPGARAGRSRAGALDAGRPATTADRGEDGLDVPRPREDLGAGPAMAARGPRPSGARRTSRGAARTAATAAAAAPSTCASIRARRRSATSSTSTTSGRRPVVAATRARRHGKAGDDLILDVPPGTAVYDDATGELIADLVATGQEAMVARGGRGGLGNTHFATSTHQAPRHAQKGEPGEERWVRPRAPADRRRRAGRAAERRQVDPARRGDRRHAQDRRLPVHDARAEPRRHGPRRRGRRRRPPRPTIADVPGLIEGASSGAGLGHAFLRHVERTRVLVHVVDGSARDPEWDFDVIRDELRAHDPALLEKPMLVAFNKIDLPSAAEAWPAFRAARAREGLRGGRDLRVDRRGDRRVPRRPRRAAARRPTSWTRRRSPSGVVVHRLDAAPDRVTVTSEPDGRVPGRRPADRAARRPDGLRGRGIGRALPARPRARSAPTRELRRAGIQAGDTVRVGAVELEWEAEPWARAGDGRA